MGDGDEAGAGAPAHLVQHAAEAVDVGVVERSVHFVQNADGRRVGQEDAEDQGAGRQGLFAAAGLGDVEAALDLYNHAIAAQGNNERLFMARAFKGRYLYELYLSASADGKLSRKKFYAQQAVASFQSAIAIMGDQPGFLDANFVRMMRECEAAEKNVM